MAGKLDHLAALLVEPYPAAPFLHIEIFDLHPGLPLRRGRRCNTSRQIGTVTKPEQGRGVDCGEELMHLVSREYG
jgi:hypothetical protein